MAWTFRTVPEELLECASCTANDFRRRGYTVRVEHQELGFPYTPTLLCTRRPTKVVVEVLGSINVGRLKEWVAYGKSAGQDFRIAVSAPTSMVMPAEVEQTLRSFGIGWYTVANATLQERIAPIDLGLNVELPELARYPMKVRQLLGPAYEQFARTQWREGFETACQVFENEARRYLKRHSRSGRITISRRGGPRTLTNRDIDKMSMGQLAQQFGLIVMQNRADLLIGQTLGTINRDRIGVTHYRQRLRTETALRRNVGRHMWSLINVLKEIV